MEEQGARSKEQGARSKEQGAAKQGARSSQARSKDVQVMERHDRCCWKLGGVHVIDGGEQAARRNEQGARSNQQPASSFFTAERRSAVAVLKFHHLILGPREQHCPKHHRRWPKRPVCLSYVCDVSPMRQISASHLLLDFVSALSPSPSPSLSPSLSSLCLSVAAATTIRTRI